MYFVIMFGAVFAAVIFVIRWENRDASRARISRIRDQLTGR